MWECALDTKNFHEPSYQFPIVAVLVPTRWQSAELPPRRVEALIQQAQANNQKIICFVTGVPGAGKTLVTV